MSDNAHSDRAHASLGASNSSIWLNCAGSYRLSLGRERKGTVYTREGTAAHELGELWLAQRLRKLEPALPSAIEVEGQVFPVTDEMHDAVGLYVETAATYIEGSVWRGVEVRVSLNELWEGKPPYPLFGTADTLALQADGTLVVCDLKYGRGKMVSPEWNPQLLYYGLGAFYAVTPELRALVKRVEFVIVQPRAGKEKVKSWSVSAVDLFMWADLTLKPSVDAIHAGDDTLTAGNHCFFCVAAPVCPAMHEAKVKRAVEAFPDIEGEVA